MWFANGGQRPHHGRRVGIDEGQRRHGIVGAPRPAAATWNIHAREAIALVCSRPRGHAQPPRALLNRYLPKRRPLRSAGGSIQQLTAPTVGRQVGDTARSRNPRTVASARRAGMAQPCGEIRHGRTRGL
jgi:hypothetical protein